MGRMQPMDRRRRLRDAMVQLINTKPKKWSHELMGWTAQGLLSEVGRTAGEQTQEQISESVLATAPIPSPTDERVAAPNSKKPHWMLWFSEKIVVGIFIGGGRLMQAISFGWTIGLIFAYLAVLLCQVLVDDKFRSKTWLRPTGVVITVAVAGWLWFGFIRAPDPLTIETRVHNGEHQQGKVHSIEWRSEYTDLRVQINNDTINEYDHADITVISPPGAWIAAADTAADAQGCRVIVVLNTAEENIIDSKTGKRSYREESDYQALRSTVLLKRKARLVCDRLVAHSSVEMVLALATPPPGFNIPSSGPDAAILVTSDSLAKPVRLGVNPTIKHVRVIYSFESVGGRPRRGDNSYPIAQY